MAEDIFDFWLRCPPHAHIHPDDEAVLARCVHGFDLRCLPGAFSGPLRTAPVVLLLANPGFDLFDLEHAGDPSGVEWYRAQRTGTQPLPSERDHRTAHAYWTKLIKQFGINEGQAAGSVAILDLAAYHSRNYKDPNFLIALPSSRMAVGWAQKELFPAAERGERAVVCLRSARQWGLPTQERIGSSLFIPRVNRGGFMLQAAENRQAVAKAVQELILS